jgi:hypothetical protein
MSASSPAEPPESPRSSFAGYRLLRRLGSGSRADVYLASGSTGTVALKVFAAGIDRDDVGRELEALSRLQSPHLVRLLDVVGIGDELPTLVLEPVRRGSISGLLAQRGSLERGEVVTVLAPVSHLVSELHLAGVAHGALALPSVHLGNDGEPIVLGLGHATLFASGLPPAALDGEPSAIHDRDNLAGIALSLLSGVHDGQGDRRTTELTSWIASTPRVFEFPAELEERLFGWAESVPIAFCASSGARSSVPARVTAPGGGTADVAGNGLTGNEATGKGATGNGATVGVELPQALSPRDRATHSELPGGIPAALLEDPFGELKQRALRMARGVRPRYWIAAAGVVSALAFATTLLPAGSSAKPRAVAETIAAAPPRTSRPLPDDPVLAVPLLLRARAGCFRDLSVLCLDDVDEASSAAFASDAASIQGIQQGGEIPSTTTDAQKTDAQTPDARTPDAQTPPVDGDRSASLVERLGDTALVRLGADDQSASVLVLKTSAGWRIRDYLTGRQATGSPATPSAGWPSG